MSAPDPPPDPTLELAALIGGAVAQASGTDREAMRDVAIEVIHGSDRVAQRLGTAIAAALLSAMQATPRPAADPVAVAQAAFKPRERP